MGINMHDLKVIIEQLRNDLKIEIEEAKTLADLEQFALNILGEMAA